MAGKSFWEQIREGLRFAFEYAWGYMGTLAAMGLVIGVLGMGIYHSWTQDGTGPEYRCFTGLINCCGAEPPKGVEEKPKDEAGPHVRFEYGPDGRLDRFVSIGGNGMHQALPGSKVAEQRMEYDAAGRLVAKRNYGPLGTPVEDAAGIAARLFRYDDAGRLVRTTLLNAAGGKIVPRMPGYAEEVISYDAQGRPTRIEYLDGEGRSIVNAKGEEVVVFTYNDDTHEVVRTNTASGKAAENAAGFAIERHRLTADGQTEYVSWHDSKGTPVENEELGGAALLSEHHAADHVERYRLCARNGVMRTRSRICAEHLIRTTPDGQTEWECYNAADGMPCNNEKSGFAERVCEYSPEGELLREYFWSERGKPCPCYEKRYIKGEGVRHVLALHTDGSTSLTRAE